MQKRQKPSKEADLKDVPQFIAKLYHILEDPRYRKAITWGEDGTEVRIINQRRLESEVLPQYFRHHKMESFIRQLNNYGFAKVTSFLRDNDDLSFTNQFFQRKNLKGLTLIQRRSKKQPLSRTSTLQEIEPPQIASQVSELKNEFDELTKNRPSLKPELTKIYEIMNRIIQKNELVQEQSISEEDQIIQAAVNYNFLQTLKDVPGTLLRFNSNCSFDREFAKHTSESD